MRIGKIMCAAALLGAASHAHGLTTPITKGLITVKLENFATVSGSSPQDLTFAPDNSGRLFLAQRSGQIVILNSQTGAFTASFLNMSAAGVSVYTGGEGGFLGLAFAPDYATSRKFYTYTTEPFSLAGPAADYSPPEMFPTTSTNPNNQVVIREWTANAANPNAANTTSRVLLRINHPQSNHQGGSITFGPDGNLYFAIGDGGGGNDFNGSASSTTDGHNSTIGNAQDLTIPLGKILRINPNPAAGAGFTLSTNGQYSIPNSNPFISGAGGALKEVYAYGLRNPYKISFDTATGTLYAADVGQGNREEVDTITSGGNYGWVFREGTRVNTTDSGRSQPGGFSSIAPFAEYTHGDGIAIIGGELYRGTARPELAGKFVFGDLAGTGSLGRLFYTDPANGTVFEFMYDPASLAIPGQLYGISAGASGELYALFASGAIYRITPIPEPASLLLLSSALLLLPRRRR